MLMVYFVLMTIALIPPALNYFTSSNLKPIKKNNFVNTIFSKDVTLILPVKNEISTIEYKVNELLNLFENKAKKLIIIDSLSSDATAIKAEKILSDSKTNIDWKVISTPILGKTACLNYVLQKIKTEWFIMFDSDAKIPKSSVDHLMSWMSDGDCGAVCGTSFATKKSDPYRYRYNIIRHSESFHDSSTIFEGSFCAVRMKALKNIKLNEMMNADDTQFALIVKKNGFRAIMEPKAIFYDYSPKSKSLMREIRRSQGIVRVLWKNKELCNLKTNYGRSYANTFYFYVIFPWFFTIFSSLLILSLDLEILYIVKDKYILSTLLFVVFIKMIPIFYHFIKGLFSLLLAHISLFLGFRMNIWEPQR
jgi:cellulose synthase/poly-beta-1,6-N-acetylglucosamine synthase-like glycosyltransferase